MRILSISCTMSMFLLAAFAVPALAAEEIDEQIIIVTPEMLHNETEVADPAGLFDEQERLNRIAPPGVSGMKNNGWTGPSNKLPWSCYVDLGEAKELSTLYMFDTNGTGEFVIEYGQPGNWQELTTTDCPKYMAWVPYELGVKTQYLRFTKKGMGGLGELALYAKPGAGFGETPVPVLRVRKQAAEEAARQKRIAENLADRKTVDAGGIYGELTLIDEIDCAAQPPKTPLFKEDPTAATAVETILSRPCRVLPNREGQEPAYFSYRLGYEKGLKAGQCYLLQVDYPEDVARTMWIINRGCETARGFSTGAALGDVIFTFTNNNSESLKFPLSGEYRTYNMLFYLHDKYPETLGIRGKDYGERSGRPAVGFDVIVAHPEQISDPMSAGLAVSRIRLFEVDDPAKYDVTLNLPPKGLPQRHLFWREEMADGVVNFRGRDAEAWNGLTDRLDWYRYKARLMKFLGMNTYCKDLLEFGAVQGWDPADNNWYWAGGYPQTWSNILDMMGQQGFSVLPYYEYSGSVGKQGLGMKLDRTRPLSRGDSYTHIKWAEKKRADLTDPDTYDDFKRVLRYTIIRHKDKANIIGAWLRPRIAQIPISFADATLARFTKETGRDAPVKREQLQADDKLLQEYYDWWFAKRREFLVAMRDYLRENGIEDAAVFYTANPGEPGPSLPGGKALVTDQVETWQKLLTGDVYERMKVHDFETVVSDNMYLAAVLDWPGTWGGWEWHHAAPPPDPQRYKDVDGVAMTYPFNRAYTVSSPKPFEAFDAPVGMAMVRHYPLNETTMGKNKPGKLGYFVVDVERAGPYCMLAEARAMANGNPRFIGYLAGNSFQRGFPQYARAFNAAFLALPALPSKVLPSAATADGVVVRMIDAGEQHGTYLAVVNPTMKELANVSVKLPAAGKVIDAATGGAMDADGGTITLDLGPCSLRAIRIGGSTSPTHIVPHKAK